MHCYSAVYCNQVCWGHLNEETLIIRRLAGMSSNIGINSVLLLLRIRFWWITIRSERGCIRSFADSLKTELNSVLLHFLSWEKWLVDIQDNYGPGYRNRCPVMCECWCYSFRARYDGLCKILLVTANSRPDAATCTVREHRTQNSSKVRGLLTPVYFNTIRKMTSAPYRSRSHTEWWILTFFRFVKNGILNLSLGSAMITAVWTAPRRDCKLDNTPAGISSWSLKKSGY